MSKAIVLSRVSTTRQELDSQTLAIKNEAFREDKITLIRQIIKRIEVWKASRYEPVADVYTNVDNNIYEIHMNSWTGDAYMMTRGLLDMAK